MSVAEQQITLTFKVTYCCHSGCGMPIAMPSQVHQRFQNNHELFYCCFGHGQHFAGPSEAERLKTQLESEKQTADWHRRRAEAADRKASAFKGQVTRIRNRVKNGVCPCCNRTFQNLMRHMATKHPEFPQPAEETDE